MKARDEGEENSHLSVAIFLEDVSFLEVLELALLLLLELVLAALLLVLALLDSWRCASADRLAALYPPAAGRPVAAAAAAAAAAAVPEAVALPLPEPTLTPPPPLLLPLLLLVAALPLPLKYMLRFGHTSAPKTLVGGSLELAFALALVLVLAFALALLLVLAFVLTGISLCLSVPYGR